MQFCGDGTISTATATIGLWLALAVSLVAGDGPAERSSKPFTTGQIRFFEAEVQPILKARCLKCHGEGPKVKAHFHVDSREGLLRGGDLGPAVSLSPPARVGCCRRSVTKSSRCRQTGSCPRQRSKSSHGGLTSGYRGRLPEVRRPVLRSRRPRPWRPSSPL